jgi:hypothetical protein
LTKVMKLRSEVAKRHFGKNKKKILKLVLFKKYKFLYKYYT